MAINKIFPKKHYLEQILYLKKKEFTIYYSCKHKYPYLVIEKLNVNTGKTKEGENIKRTEITDPFAEDLDIPEKYRLTKKDYLNYMMYGGSMGHNAPAGNHKTDYETYMETFKFSNMAPQEITFNSGVWVVLESWCRYLSKNFRIKKLMVITGSIPAQKNKKFNTSSINVPTHMFKLVFCQERMPLKRKRRNKIYCACFLYPNQPINPTSQNIEIHKYLIPLNVFQYKFGINVNPILGSYYHYNPKYFDIENLSTIVNINFYLNNYMVIQMKKAEMYGMLIYSNTLDELDKNWQICLSLEESFKDLQYHKEYYDFAKKRIKLKSRSVSKTKKKKKKHLNNL